jgi:hypothetical protein
VRRLLHEEGYTIKGVQKLHRELGAKRFVSAAAAPPSKPDGPPPATPAILDAAARRRLCEALEDLQAAKARLDQLLGEG